MVERITTVEQLVSAREARGHTVDDIVRQLKLSSRQVHSLERGDWASLPGIAFVRGALRSYGRLLGVDVEALLEAAGAQLQASELRPASTLDEPLPRRGLLGFGSGGSGNGLAWTLLVVIGVVALAFFFQLRRRGLWLIRVKLVL